MSDPVSQTAADRELEAWWQELTAPASATNGGAVATQQEAALIRNLMLAQIGQSQAEPARQEAGAAGVDGMASWSNGTGAEPDLALDPDRMRHWQQVRARMLAQGLLGVDQPWLQQQRRPRSSAMAGVVAALSGLGLALRRPRSVWAVSLLLIALLALLGVQQAARHDGANPPATAPSMSDPPFQLRGDESGGEGGAPSWQRLTVAEPTEFAAQLEAQLLAAQLRVRVQAYPEGVWLEALIPPDHAALRAQLSARGVAVPEHGRLRLWLPVKAPKVLQ